MEWSRTEQTEKPTLVSAAGKRTAAAAATTATEAPGARASAAAAAARGGRHPLPLSHLHQQRKRWAVVIQEWDTGADKRKGALPLAHMVRTLPAHVVHLHVIRAPRRICGVLWVWGGVSRGEEALHLGHGIAVGGLHGGGICWPSHGDDAWRDVAAAPRSASICGTHKKRGRERNRERTRGRGTTAQRSALVWSENGGKHLHVSSAQPRAAPLLPASLPPPQ